ncbi:hypothetical protein NpPPO83_00009231 [Neofusicoccum parvum]|uniref:Uncharacterized protein n=1 Tax=Neofusicoccum parvum TaxID=310453 RepID=A0ACB5RR29_9PEZI|nr:hypothetical protein NpPPO83_00009231 [Neofusicoccum parvum]
MTNHAPPAPPLAPHNPPLDLPTTTLAALANSATALTTCHATVRAYRALAAPLEAALRTTPPHRLAPAQLRAFVALTARLAIDVPWRRVRAAARHRLAIAALRVAGAAAVLRKLARGIEEVGALVEGVGAGVGEDGFVGVEYAVARVARRVADLGRECETHCGEMRRGVFLDMPRDVAEDEEVMGFLRGADLEQTTFLSMAADEVLGATAPCKRERWLKALLEMDERFWRRREGWERVRKVMEDGPIGLGISISGEESEGWKMAQEEPEEEPFDSGISGWV